MRSDKKRKSNMLIDERRQHMLAKIQSDGRVLVSEVAESLGISRITIRKDLDYLVSRGLAQRTHGVHFPSQSGALVRPLSAGKRT